MRRLVLALIWLSCSCIAADAQQTGRIPIEPSSSGPAPKQATDLDTLKLASAHREKPQSMDERTNGLWQSWLVSICQGCVDLPPGAQHVQAVARRDAEESRRSASARINQRSAQNDLSTEALDQIRSLPQTDR